jgi:hypothetical protein
MAAAIYCLTAIEDAASLASAPEKVVQAVNFAAILTGAAIQIAPRPAAVEAGFHGAPFLIDGKVRHSFSGRIFFGFGALSPHGYRRPPAWKAGAAGDTAA